MISVLYIVSVYPFIVLFHQFRSFNTVNNFFPTAQIFLGVHFLARHHLKDVNLNSKIALGNLHYEDKEGVTTPLLPRWFVDKRNASEHARHILVLIPVLRNIHTVSCRWILGYTSEFLLITLSSPRWYWGWCWVSQHAIVSRPPN